MSRTAVSPPAMVPGREFASAAIVGERKNQEDYARFTALADGALLAVLADGMGGHAAGEVASQEAVEAFCAAFQRGTTMSVGARLIRALEAANAAIGRRIAADQALDGMGCTLVAVHIGDEGLRWVSVGDSPLYLLKSGRLAQINEDHSMGTLIEESVSAGKLSRAEADQHPSRNVLRSALLGDEPPELVDLREDPLPLAKGDLIVVASDGLQTLSQTEIGRVLASAIGKPADSCAQALLDAVERQRAPRQDNTTVQVIHAVPSTRRPSAGHARGPKAVPRTKRGTNWIKITLVCGLGGVLLGLAVGKFWFLTDAAKSPSTHKAAPSLLNRLRPVLPAWTQDSTKPESGFESADGKTETRNTKQSGVPGPAPSLPTKPEPAPVSKPSGTVGAKPSGKSVDSGQ